MKFIKYSTSFTLLLSTFMSIQVNAQDIELSSLESRAAYSIGANIGANMVTQGVDDDLDLDALLAGFRDSFLGGDLQMSQEELTLAMQEFSAIQQAKAEASVVENQQAGIDFLAENALKPGVTSTASGLQYLVMEESADVNAASPAASNSVTVHYHGTLIDGTVFDSSVERGESISFPLSGVISGWTEGLQLMSVGDKFRFFIPSDLAYGASGAGGIGPNTTLIFDVELLGFE